MIKGGRQTQDPMESPGSAGAARRTGSNRGAVFTKKTKSYLQAVRGIEEF